MQFVPFLFSTVEQLLQEGLVVSQETPKTKSNPFFKVGEPAPEVTLRDESGKAVTLSSFWKEKPTLVVFLRHFG